VAFGIPHGIEAMSWITIVWSMASAMCATLALIHLAIWFQKRSEVVPLLFALTAFGALTFRDDASLEGHLSPGVDVAQARRRDKTIR
jgi:hypothetical protein